MKAGDIYETKAHGTLEIMEYRGAFDVSVRFIDTGYEVTTSAGNIRQGCIKDKLVRTVYGIGYFGVGEHRSTKNKRPNYAYKAWQAMLQRCYDAKYHQIRPTYSDCSVCDEWHNFQVFAEWYEINYPQDGGKYQLDKDIKIKGNRQYSPDTCMFVTLAKNTAEAGQKTYKLTTPNGDEITICNMAQFCKGNDLNASHMIHVATGKRKSHKGWKSANKTGAIK
ncbi:HNH endonuclease [Vibrio phage PS15B-6]|nr:hypothetical protein MYOV066v1_p0005 [Vibrio phage PS15B.3]QZI90854.1 hypothetical protein MYOV064v1_p0004 [Vibrio phage PS15B.4]